MSPHGIYLLFTYQKMDDLGFAIMYSVDNLSISWFVDRSERNAKMLATNLHQTDQVVVQQNPFTSWTIAIEVQEDRSLEKLLAELSPEVPWGDRQIAAKKLGKLRNSAALPGLVAALPRDPFWMVRCAIIQALEQINDPAAIPALREVANNDGFQIVRSYAAKAIERLS